MKKGYVLRLLVLFSVVAAAFGYLSFSITGSTLSHSGDDTVVMGSSRKLKDITVKRGARSVHVNDYLPIDPAPSSKASIRPGPIEHGTPLMPHMPKSPPPDPSNGGSVP